MTETPILVTTEELDDHLDSGEVRVVDLSKLGHYVSSHIPGLGYGWKRNVLIY